MKTHREKFTLFQGLRHTESRATVLKKKKKDRKLWTGGIIILLENVQQEFRDSGIITLVSFKIFQNMGLNSGTTFYL
jgi:hypothetical protein